MMTLADWKNLFSIIGTIGAIFAALWAAFVYWRNSRLERAKWALNLYERFYEKENLKKVREILDSDANNEKVAEVVHEESIDFTDYLNFFEFVAFLRKSKQLQYNEIEDLFSYYIDKLNCHNVVRQYIREKGYEGLDRLLKNRIVKTRT